MLVSRSDQQLSNAGDPGDGCSTCIPNITIDNQSFASTKHSRDFDCIIDFLASKKSVGLMKKISGYVAPQDMALLSSALVILYLIVGENAEFVCDLFTSIPAVIFTYKIITSPRNTKTTYEAILCFWILNGILSIVDHFLKQTTWYFLVKFLLMCAVATHVLAKCHKAGVGLRRQVLKNSYSPLGEHSEKLELSAAEMLPVEMSENVMTGLSHAGACRACGKSFKFLNSNFLGGRGGWSDCGNDFSMLSSLLCLGGCGDCDRCGYDMMGLGDAHAD